MLRIAAIFHGYATEGEVEIESDRIGQIWRQSMEEDCQRQVTCVAIEEPELAATIREDFNTKISEVQKAREELTDWFNSEHPAMQGGMRSALEKHTAVVSLEEIEKTHGWNLNITRYVDANEPPERLDVALELENLYKLEKARDEAEVEMNRLLEEFKTSNM